VTDPGIWVAVIGFAGIVFSAVITYAGKAWRDGPGSAVKEQRVQNGVLGRIIERLDDGERRNHAEHEAFLETLRATADRNLQMYESAIEKLSDIIAPRQRR